jgi:phosphoserine phosphatase
MEILLINEELVSRFNFWRNAQVQQGMRYGSELFRLASRFSNHQRQQAFELAQKLSWEGAKQVVVTATAKHYTVWVSLRARSNAAPKPELPQLLSMALHA